MISTAGTEAGLDRVTSGDVRIGGVNIAGLSDRQLTRLRRDTIGFVFQAFNLIPALTARQNVELPRRLAGRVGAFVAVALGVAIVAAMVLVLAAAAADQASVLLVTGLALVYSVIAIANVMAIASAGRRSEFLALRLAGATRSHVLRLAASESALCAAIGTVAAAGAGLTVIVVQRFVLASAAGGFPPHLPWLPAGVVAAAGTVIGVLAAVTTAARVMREPASALAG